MAGSGDLVMKKIHDWTVLIRLVEESGTIWLCPLIYVPFSGRPNPSSQSIKPPHSLDISINIPTLNNAHARQGDRGASRNEEGLTDAEREEEVE